MVIRARKSSLVYTTSVVLAVQLLTAFPVWATPEEASAQAGRVQATRDDARRVARIQRRAVRRASAVSAHLSHATSHESASHVAHTQATPPSKPKRMSTATKMAIGVGGLAVLAGAGAAIFTAVEASHSAQTQKVDPIVQSQTDQTNQVQSKDNQMALQVQPKDNPMALQVQPKDNQMSAAPITPVSSP